MNQNEEIKVLLQGIEILRYELYDCDIESNLLEYAEKFKRLNNLLFCLSNIAWTIHGNRFNDKESNDETNNVSYKEITTNLKTRIG